MDPASLSDVDFDAAYRQAVAEIDRPQPALVRTIEDELLFPAWWGVISVAEPWPV